MDNQGILDKIELVKKICFKILPLLILIVVGIVGYRYFSSSELKEEKKNLQAELAIANEKLANAESRLENSEKKVKNL